MERSKITIVSFCSYKKTPRVIHTHGEFIITDKIHSDLPLNVVVQSERNRQWRNEKISVSLQSLKTKNKNYK